MYYTEKLYRQVENFEERGLGAVVKVGRAGLPPRAPVPHFEV
jgi:hypothetical protein